MGDWEENPAQDLRRCKVLGGWLIATISYDSLCYMPDSLHVWDWDQSL